MGPFGTLRSWLRAGPLTERVLTGLTGALVLSLVVWASVPRMDAPAGSDALGAAPAASAGGSPTGATTDAGNGVTAPSVSGPAVKVPGGPTTTTVTTGPAATSPVGGGPAPVIAGDPCAHLTATDQGVTATQVVVGVSLPDLGSLGAAFNVPTVAQQQKAWNAVFAVYNKSGGVPCRTMVPKYYSDDVTSATAEHATCLTMVQDKLFAVLQNFYFPEESTCLAQNHVPNFWYIPPHTNQVKKYYPYILSYQPDYDRLVRDYVRGSMKLGWFSGYQRVGILEGSCFPDLNAAMDRELTAIGIPSSKRATFSYGCDPSAPSQPDKDTQAVLQFERAGVTHVLSVAYGRSFSFSSIADGQNYQPKYAVMDDGQIAGSNHSSANPTGAGFNGALGIAVSSLGEADTPEVHPGPATARCAAIMQAAGLPSPLSSGGAAYGSPCAGIAMFVAASSHATTLTRTALVGGLARVGALDLSFPAGPANFHDVGNPTGGGFWRPLRFDRPANCWRVASAAFQKGFS